MTSTRLIGIAALAVALWVSAAPAVVVVDNDAGAPAYTETGNWGTSSAVGYNGGTYRYATAGGAHTATWTANLPEAGELEVFVWYVPGSNRATATKYTVSAADGNHTVYLSQAAGGLTWESLGTFNFNAGANTITVDAAGSSPAGNVVIADAVSFGEEIIEPDPPIVEEITAGVTHYTYTLPTPVVIHVLEFDLADPQFTIDMGFAYGQRSYPTKQPVPTIVDHYDSSANEVIAAINCSYFDTGPTIGVLGFLGSDSNIIQNTAAGAGLAQTYGLLNNGEGWAASNIPSIAGTVAFADGAETQVGTLNLYCGGGLALYTPDWGPSTANNYAGAEVIVENVNFPMRPGKEIAGTITAVHSGAAAINNPIPDDGFVLSACAGAEANLLAHASVGDQVAVRFAMQPDMMNNVRTMVTGNVWLVKDGVRYQSGGDAVRHPRTAIAWSGTQHWYVTWDGRQAGYSVGASFVEMQDFLVDVLHVDNAINLDGGGSTTMVIDDEVVNCPSDGASTPCTGNPRSVPNALMLMRRTNPSTRPVNDPFDATGRALAWDDKFTFNPVAPFAFGAETHALEVLNPAGGFETLSLGRRNDVNYTIEAEVYCPYRPDVATDGFERVGVFARDDGNGGFESADLGGGNCYALTYDTHDGRVRAGTVVDGVFTDRLAAPLHVTTSGWRKMSIEAYGSTIGFHLDGALIASIDDALHASGRCGIGHHEYFATDANAQGAHVRRFLTFTIDLDADNNGTIDLVDFQYLMACMLGPTVHYAPGNYCLPMDTDGDLDVDLLDAWRFDQYKTIP